MNSRSNEQPLVAGALGIFVGFFLATPALAGVPMFRQAGHVLAMSNAAVRVEYDLQAGTADFFWRNSRKISRFYSSARLGTRLVKSLDYSSHAWAVASNNQVVITSTAGSPAAMKQYFILDQDNSFLTRVEMDGIGLSSSSMAPVVMEAPGGVDIGSYDDARALCVPFDNDHFVRYDAMPIDGTGTSYEVCAFYDNTTRVGLVVGSVTHDTWKTGIHFSGSRHKLDVLNVFGGATAANATWDVMPHGAVVGNTISSPTVFVGFGSDWRNTLEEFADANAALATRLTWTNGVPFGWNSWGVIQKNLSYSKAIAVSDFIKTNLQSNNFQNDGTVYVNLDSYWKNLDDSQLSAFADHCHGNGQKAGIYWGPFAYWGGAARAASTFVEGAANKYEYSDILLRDGTGNYETNDGALAIDPTHPGTRQLIDYYANLFVASGFDYLKLDFLSHGALEGVHFDTNVTTGIQAYNQGMRYLLRQIGGRMFIDESIAPIFPYQYAHARRISCDAFYSIADAEYEMQSVNYGWWMSGRLYEYIDPDQLVFAGGDVNENQSRLVSGAVTGIFLDGDDLSSSAGQDFAQACLTNAAINSVARAGRPFTPVEGNTGRRASNVFVRRDGADWLLAVFNFATNAVNPTIDLGRAGLGAGTYAATDLWSGDCQLAHGSFGAHLNSKQAKLFRLAPNSTNSSAT